MWGKGRSTSKRTQRILMLWTRSWLPGTQASTATGFPSFPALPAGLQDSPEGICASALVEAGPDNAVLVELREGKAHVPIPALPETLVIRLYP